MPSSVIARFSYDPAAGILRIRFVSGLIYDYKQVPEHIYEAMKRARSKGGFFNKRIKDQYDFERISD